MRVRPAAIAFAALVLVLGAGAVAANGDPATAAPSIVGCAANDLASAPLVFTGRVVSVTNQARTARVSVQRVYRGGPVSARVEVKGTRAEASGIVSAIDRTYVAGTEYVFAPLYGSNPHFEETACSATQVRSAATDGAAPPGGGTAPAPGGLATSVRRLPVALFVGLGAALVLLLLLVVGQRRLRRRPATDG